MGSGEGGPVGWGERQQQRGNRLAGQDLGALADSLMQVRAASAGETIEAAVGVVRARWCGAPAETGLLLVSPISADRPRRSGQVALLRSAVCGLGWARGGPSAHFHSLFRCQSHSDTAACLDEARDSAVVGARG